MGVVIFRRWYVRNMKEIVEMACQGRPSIRVAMVESDRHVICSRDAPKEHPIQIESTCSGSRMAETKVIRTFANEVEAYVAQAVLNANGIDSE